MLYYPIDTSSGGGGGGGGGILMGVAYIQRDADFTEVSAFPPVSILKGCSYKYTAGEAGSLDSSIGRVLLPEGCRFIKVTLHENIPGLSSGLRVIHIRTQTFDPSGFGMTDGGDDSGNFVRCIIAMSVEDDDWFEAPVYSMSQFVLTADEYGSKHIGMLEFYA